jgi:hypothetical protein
MRLQKSGARRQSAAAECCFNALRLQRNGSQLAVRLA